MLMLVSNASDFDARPESDFCNIVYRFIETFPSRYVIENQTKKIMTTHYMKTNLPYSSIFTACKVLTLFLVLLKIGI